MSEQPLILQLSADTYADRALIGGKAASLLTLAGIGAEVPPAFVLTTEAWRRWAANPDRGFVAALVDEGIAGLEARAGRKLGDGLIVSVRSGAPVSMPGMMDTVLNAGIGTPPPEAEDFIREARLRFLRQYCELVLGIEPGDARTEDDFRALAGDRWPQTPRDELVGAAEAVFASWQSSRARLYRRMRKIDDALGTAVTIQQMVFGNRDARSGSGVAFTRDPTSGAHGLTGEYIAGGQGEEIVAGKETGAGLDGWRAAQPECFEALRVLGERLEADSGKVHEIEFTVEQGRLYVLQCRPALLTARGAARVAVEMVREGRLNQGDALAYAMAHGFDPAADPEAMGIAPGHEPAGRGLAVGGGVAAGRLAFDTARAAELAAEGTPVVFATVETSPALLPVMQKSAALLTMSGGATSHAAVVARELGTPCVVGMGAEIADGTLWLGEGLNAGDWVTVDGDSGEVFAGNVGVMMSRLDAFEAELRDWAASAPARRQA